MKKMNFECVNKFVEHIDDVLNHQVELDRFASVSVVAKYDEAKQVLACLFSDFVYEIHSLEIHDVEWEGYDKEYIISICIGESGLPEVWCEKFMNEDKYLYNESNVTYILDNCSSACIPYCEGGVNIETNVSFDNCNDEKLTTEEFECNGDCVSCPIADEVDKESNDEKAKSTQDGITLKSDDGNINITIYGKFDPYKLFDFYKDLEDQINNVNKMIESFKGFLH